MPEKIILPNSYLELAEEELRLGKSVKLLADGLSMYPFIRGGKDVTEIFPMSEDEELDSGRVYMFKHKGKYIIHRFIEKRGDEYVMMGDGNRGNPEKVKRKDVVGVLKFIHRSDGRIIDCTSPQWITKGKVWVRMRPLRRYLLSACHRLSNLGIIR